jgi:hypothetical protein
MKRIALALTFALLVCSSLFAANPKDPPAITLPVTYTFVNINYPNSTATYFFGINNDGYIGGVTNTKGFVVVPSSTCPPVCNFKTENYPGAVYTAVLGINNDYNFETAGSWRDKAGNYHGFLHNSGNWWDVVYPGTNNNQLYGLNDNNMAAGFYYDGAGKAHAYIYSQPGNQYVPLFISGSDNARAYDINDYNQIVGTYYDSSGYAHGFEFDPFFTALNYPGATNTYASGINNYGAIVGSFYDSFFQMHGFIYYLGTWQQLDNPDSVGETIVFGINDDFEIVGRGKTSDTTFGFEAIPY